MFEKEAEEYLKTDGTKAEQILNMLNEISPLKITSKQVPFILAMIQQVFQDAATFGYTKAKKADDIQQEKLFAHYVYARSLISDLLRNSDEYAKQRAEEFIVKEEIPPKE